MVNLCCIVNKENVCCTCSKPLCSEHVIEQYEGNWQDSYWCKRCHRVMAVITLSMIGTGFVFGLHGLFELVR